MTTTQKLTELHQLHLAQFVQKHPTTVPIERRVTRGYAKKMGINVNGIPGIKLFLKDSNQEINFWGKDDEEEMIQFLERHTRKSKKEL